MVAIGPKNTQTRFVGIITSTIHSNACFSRLSCVHAPKLMSIIFLGLILDSNYFDIVAM